MTSDAEPVVVDPERKALLRTVCRPLPLEELAVHVAAMSSHQKRLYVDRRPDGYRWSFVHPGGPYPLWREVAQFLKVPYQRILVGGREVGDRWCVLIGPDGDDDPETEAWAVLELTRKITPAKAATMISDALDK